MRCAHHGIRRVVRGQRQAKLQSAIVERARTLIPVELSGPRTLCCSSSTDVRCLPLSTDVRPANRRDNTIVTEFPVSSVFPGPVTREVATVAAGAHSLA